MSEPENQQARSRRRHLGGAVAFVIGCLSCASAAAESAPTEVRGAASANTQAPEPTTFEQAVAADIGMLSYQWSGRPYSATAIGASYRLSGDQLEAAAGARGLLSSNLVGALFEVFVSGALTPALGFWHPSLGVELGYSSLTTADRATEPKVPAAIDEASRSRLGRAYICLAAAPLRVRFGAFNVTTLELDVGSTLPDLGRGFRIAIVLARLEWRLP